MMRKKIVLCLSLFMIVFFSSCSYASTDGNRGFYASFRANQDMLTIIETKNLIFSSIKDLYVNTFDYLEEDTAILSLDIEESAKIQETINDINDEIEGAMLSISLNESIMPLYEKRLSQAAPSTEMEQYETANLENQLKLARYNQIQLEKTLRKARARLTAAENTLNQPEIILSPVSGYLMELVLKWNDEGALLIGSIVPENAVYLELNCDGGLEFAVGQKIEVFLFDNWIPMLVLKNDTTIQLAFDSVGNDLLDYIQFTYPIIVQIRQ